MLRPATTDELAALIAAAASASDVELDRALLRVGILAPADLGDIRAILCGTDVELCDGANGDGHRRIEVRSSGCCRGWVHHDGRIQVTTSFAA